MCLHIDSYPAIRSLATPSHAGYYFAVPTVRLANETKPNIAKASFTLTRDEASEIAKALPKLKDYLEEKWAVTRIKIVYRNPCYPDHAQFSIWVDLAKDVTSTVVTLAGTAMSIWVGKKIKDYRKTREKNREGYDMNSRRHKSDTKTFEELNFREQALAMNAAAAQYRKMLNANLRRAEKEGRSVESVRRIRLGLLERIVRDYSK